MTRPATTPLFADCPPLAGGTGQAGMWRYRPVLPVPSEGAITYPLPVGGTPLHRALRLRETLGVSTLWLKDETRGPTCSNKDRATALVLELGLREGAKVVSCASTGNVAVSLAVGAAAMGVHAVVFVPADISDSKLVTLLFTGATVLRVGDGYQAAFELSRRAAREFGWLERNTGVNPATTEAKKTVALEIWEQLGQRVPDTLVVPVGDGTTLCGVAKGFQELVAHGAARRILRIIGVQSEGCRPVVDAWKQGVPIAPVTPNTIADGVAVGAPVLGVEAMRDVTASGGAFVSVPDAATVEAMQLLTTSVGIIPEPAGAVALAGMKGSLDTGLISRDEEVVVEVTGSGLKRPRI